MVPAVKYPALDLTASDLLTGYAAGDLDPVAVADQVLAVVETAEPTLNALWDHDPDAVRAAAAASSQRWASGTPCGPLDGVPVTVKENLARAGVPMPAGNAGVTPVVPDRDSPTVERLLAAGAVIVGSTVMPDWGMLSSGVSSKHGQTRSPWNPAWTTGGSSSGAGAAAAAGYGPLHVGTDIGGSIRLPGTWLGLATLKPSQGRVPLDAPYLGRVAGPLTRTVADAALLMSVISGWDDRDWTASPVRPVGSPPGALDPRGLRVGVQLDAGYGMPVDASVVTAVRRAAEVFADAGAVVDELTPFTGPDAIADLDRFWRVRSYVDFAALDEAARDRVLPFVRRWCEAGSEVSGPETLRCYQAAMGIARDTVRATEAFDVVLSPVAPVAAFPAEWPMPWGDADQAMSHIGFTAPFNMSGQPAGTVNAGFTDDGRPIGVQVSGRRYDDDVVLAAMAWFEAHRDASAVPVWPTGGVRA